MLRGSRNYRGHLSCDSPNLDNYSHMERRTVTACHAVSRQTNDANVRHDMWDALFDALPVEAKNNSLAHYNDSHTFEDVKAVFEREMWNI